MALPQNHRIDNPIAFIQARLQAMLAPISLTIHDDSAQHAGHVGAASGGHFNITVVSSAFNGKTRIARHRLIYGALADAMQRGIHALAIAAYTPEEYKSHSIKTSP